MPQCVGMSIPKLYTLKEAATALRCCEKTVDRMRKSGELLTMPPGKKNRGKWTFPESTIVAYLDGLTEAQGDVPSRVEAPPEVKKAFRQIRIED